MTPMTLEKESTRTNAEAEPALLPGVWQVYGPVESNHLLWWPPDSMTAVMNLWPDRLPEEVEADGRVVARRAVTVADGRLDLARFIGGNVYDERQTGFHQDSGKTANVFIPFELQEDQELTFGFGADWWFAAYLDGKQLADSLVTGNVKSPPSSRDIQKMVQVSKGKHLLALRAICGGEGAELCVSASRQARRVPPYTGIRTREWTVTDADVERGRAIGAPTGAFTGRRVVMEADIEYGRAGERPLTLDLIRPKDRGKEPLPVIMWVHGGGWEMGNKEYFRRMLFSYFAATGKYIGVTVGYRLSGEAVWPAPLHDCKAALRWIRANAGAYGMDAERIGVMGESAGGHLAALLGTSGDAPELEGANGHPGQSSRVRCVADFCGLHFFDPADFAAHPKHRLVHRCSSLLLGGPLAERRKEAHAAAPLTWVSKQTPPFLVVHGTADLCVPFPQGERFAAGLKAAGVPVTFLRVEGAGHNDLWESTVGRRAFDFFERHLRGQTVEISDAPIRFQKAQA